MQCEVMKKTMSFIMVLLIGTPALSGQAGIFELEEVKSTTVYRNGDDLSLEILTKNRRFKIPWSEFNELGITNPHQFIKDLKENKTLKVYIDSTDRETIRRIEY